MGPLTAGAATAIRRRTAGDRLTSKLVNPFARALLRSPVHDLLSDRVVLLSLRGNRSGRRLSIPVNYLLDDDDVLTILSLRRRAGGATFAAVPR